MLGVERRGAVIVVGVYKSWIGCHRFRLRVQVLWETPHGVEKQENRTFWVAGLIMSQWLTTWIVIFPNIPEFDEIEMRSRLAQFQREELIEMLIRSYKEKRLIAKMFDELSTKLNRIHLVP